MTDTAALPAHASLGASSAYRWMRCAGSPAFIASLDPADRREGSTYAEEGSAAHALAEHCLADQKRAEEFLGWQLRRDAEGMWRLLQDEPQVWDWTVTPEMAEGVQLYLDTIEEERSARPGALCFVEQRVFPLADREEMFGTADFILWDFVDGVLVVTDLKFGKGVVVDPEHNAQAMYYGLGALRKLGLGPEDVARVELVICQPRAAHTDGPVRRWTLTSRELVEWGGVLRSAADATKAPTAALQAGEWCRFCPAAGLCPELRRSAFEAAQMVFKPVVQPPEVDTTKLPMPNPANPQEVAAALSFVPMIDAWCREVEGHAQRFMERGGHLPGFKLVRKRANRRWKDEEALKAALDAAGAPRCDTYTEPELKSPAQMEKVKALGSNAKERAAWVAPFTEKPEGGLTVATESDPREGVEAPMKLVFANAGTLPANAGKDAAGSGSETAEEILL